MRSDSLSTGRILTGLARLGLVAAICVLAAAAWGNDRTEPDRTPGNSARSGESLEYLLAWGEHALAQGRYSEAEARFRDVLDIDWNHPRAFDLMMEARDKRKQALKEWGRAAWAAASAGDHDKAIAYYGKILAEDPDNASVQAAAQRVRRKRDIADHIQAGLAKFILEDYTGAQLDFEQALAIDPTDSLAVLYRDKAERNIGHSSSLADIRSDDDAWGRYLEALKKFRAGDLTGAEHLWRSLLEQYPGNDAVQSNLEQVTRRQKQEFSANDVAP